MRLIRVAHRVWLLVQENQKYVLKFFISISACAKVPTYEAKMVAHAFYRAIARNISNQQQHQHQQTRTQAQIQSPKRPSLLTTLIVKIDKCWEFINFKYNTCTLSSVHIKSNVLLFLLSAHVERRTITCTTQLIDFIIQSIFCIWRCGHRNRNTI